MTRIPENTTIIGEIRCTGNMRVDGRVEGQSDVQGILVITKNSVYEGDKIILASFRRKSASPS